MMKKLPSYDALVLEGGSLRCACTAGVLDAFAAINSNPKCLKTPPQHAPVRTAFKILEGGTDAEYFGHFTLVRWFLHQVHVDSTLDVERKNLLPRSHFLLVRGNNIVKQKQWTEFHSHWGVFYWLEPLGFWGVKRKLLTLPRPKLTIPHLKRLHP